MEENVKKAIEYINRENGLNNDFLIAELDKIIKDIKNGNCDESFLYCASELVKLHQSNNSMEEDTSEIIARK